MRATPHATGRFSARRARALIAVAVFTASAPAQEEPGSHVAIRPGLAEQRVSTIASGADALVAPVDPGETLRLDDLLLVTPVGGMTPLDAAALLAGRNLAAQAQALVETVDGQRFLATLTEESNDTALALRVEGKITARIPIERLASVRFAPDAGRELPPSAGGDPSADGAAVDDVVELANGDTLRGFLLEVSPDIVSIETAGDVLDIPTDRVRLVTLANPPAPPADRLVSTLDGLTIAARGIEVRRSGGKVELALDIAHSGSASSATLSIAARRFAGLWQATDAGRLVPLAGLARTGHAPLGGRRWAPPPVEVSTAVGGFADLAIAGPARTTWSVPYDAVRFAAGVRLVGGPWGDAELSLKADDETLFRADLSHQRPEASINTELPPGASTLALEITEGANGPVQDEIRLIRPRLLIRVR